MIAFRKVYRTDLYGFPNESKTVFAGFLSFPIEQIARYKNGIRLCFRDFPDQAFLILSKRHVMQVADLNDGKPMIHFFMRDHRVRDVNAFVFQKKRSGQDQHDRSCDQNINHCPPRSVSFASTLS